MSWMLLIIWERHVTLADGIREPVLPWRFFTQRYIGGILLCLMFLGGPFVISVYQLPQRFQTVNGLTGLEAGVRLIPFTLLAPVGTGIAASVAGRLKVPPIYIIIIGALFQVIGFTLLGTLPTTTEFLPRIYGFEIIAGFGCGMNLALLFVIIPGVVEARDQAVAMGAASQFRMMGSAIAAAIVTSVYNGYTQPRLENASIRLGMGLVNTTADKDVIMREIYAGGYNQQLLVLAAFAAAQIPAAMLLWKTPQIKA
ncbi:hypothetical protein Hte_002782 [Hypoxylon texense]